MDNHRRIEAAYSLARLSRLLQQARNEWENLQRLIGPEDGLYTDLYAACQEVMPLNGPGELLACLWLIQEVVQEHVEGPAYIVLRWRASLWRDVATAIEAHLPELAARIRRALPAHGDDEVDFECNTLVEARRLRVAAARLS